MTDLIPGKNTKDTSQASEEINSLTTEKDEITKEEQILAQKQRVLQQLTTLKEQRQTTRFEDEEYTLPDELLLQIFSRVKRRDLYSIGITCRQWHRLSNDHSLGWHPVLTLAFRESVEAYCRYEGMSIYFLNNVSNVRWPSEPSWDKVPWQSDYDPQLIELQKTCHKSFMKKHPGVPVSLHHIAQEWPKNLNDYNDNHERREYNFFTLRDAHNDVIAMAHGMHFTSRFAGNWIASVNWTEINGNPDLYHIRIRPCMLVQIKDSGEYNTTLEIPNANRLSWKNDPDVRHWFVDVEFNIAMYVLLFPQLIINNNLITFNI